MTRQRFAPLHSFLSALIPAAESHFASDNGFRPKSLPTLWRRRRFKQNQRKGL
jgi:hypothetical protein